MSQDVWTSYSRNWRNLGPPQRPSESDGRAMLDFAAPTLRVRAGRAEVVILGVTPELATLGWPGVARIHAIDESLPMIKSVWRPHPAIASEVTQARWQQMPLADGSADVVAGDGALNSLPGPDDYREVLREVARVLAPDGVLVLRCYTRPQEPEELDRIAAETLAGRIGSFHVLRWRIAMALKRDDMRVAVAEILEAFARMFPDREKLSMATGWPLSAINTIEAYATSRVRYTFPTRGELAALTGAFFDATEERTGACELADRCPTICLRHRQAGRAAA